jgi:hypothetical protein
MVELAFTNTVGVGLTLTVTTDEFTQPKTLETVIV